MVRLQQYSRAIGVIAIGLLFVILGNPVPIPRRRRHIRWRVWTPVLLALLAGIFRWRVKEAQQEQDAYYTVPAASTTRSPSVEMGFPTSGVPGVPQKADIPSHVAPSGPDKIPQTETTSESQQGREEKTEESVTLEQGREPIPRRDDLTLIEGIGPKIARMLNEWGISTFEELANADPELLHSRFRQAKLYFVNPSTWPRQASLAAEGRHEALKALQKELKSGRRRTSTS